MASTEMVPVRLRCEYLTDPLGIEEASPRLGWAIEAGGRGRKQSSYQITAAGNMEDLETGEDLLWDTGKVVSSDSVGVPYEGRELRPGARCYWKVRVWDEAGDPSPYSEPAFWEMGLPRRSDWSGAWISPGEIGLEGVEPPSGAELENAFLMGLTPCPYLRKGFDLDKQVRRARLYATARGVYELYLNGSRVGEDVLAPGWTDYNSRIQYQTHDVKGMLRAGENVLGGVLGDGWYAGFVGMDPKRSGAHYGTRPELLVQLDVEYEDGSTERVVSDGSWKGALGPILYSDLLAGEAYDARRELGDWDEPGFDDSGWRPVEARDLDDTPLVAEPDQGIKVTEEIEAKALTGPEGGRYVFDLGQNMVGWVRLKARGEAGTRITLRHAEILNPDGTIYTENLRGARQVDEFILKGDGEETFEPRFTSHGFRYVEVSGYPGGPSLDAVTGRVVHSATPTTGSFECSDPMVNKLQENIVWGQRGNFLSVPTDCPQRDERLGWTGDAQVFVRTASYNMDVSAFFAKWMKDVEDAQSPEGAFPDVAPLLDMSIVDLGRGAPAWGDAGVIVPWTIYRVYGDLRIIERHYDAMTRWMDYIREGNPDLLRTRRLGNNFGDWLSVGADTPKDVLATAYWAYDAKLMAEMARAIGREDDAKDYEDLYREVASAFTDAYVSPDGRIKGDTQTVYVVALHMGLLPGDLRPKAAEHLVRTIEEKDWHLSTGFVGVGYLCPVLTEAGRLDVAYRLLENETFPSWGYSIRHGATTIWERWDGWTEEGGFQSPNMNSFNHYSLGSVGEWLYRYVAGIDAASPGFGRILIRPHPGGSLTHARAEYDSVRGTIRSGWETSGGEIRLKVTIPANTEATVHVPTTDAAGVTEGGRPAGESEGVGFIREDERSAVFTVGSGEYEFVGSTR